VYGRGDGGWVDEDTPVADAPAPHGRARLDAERTLFAAGDELGVETVSLRIAAIYGPGRGVHERLRAGAFAVPGDGANWISRIHVDDLAAAIVAAGAIAALPRRVYVIGDDEPATARAHADGVAALLGVAPPPSVPIETLSPEAAELRLANRRVRNARMKHELGVRLAYATWREGTRAAIATAAATAAASGPTPGGRTTPA
jgi:nucleoside-diphosphate-sugar epimerase